MTKPKPRGFTLVEMLTALALCTIIMTLIITAFSISTRIYKQSHARIDASRSAAVTLRVLETDLQCMPADPVLLVSPGVECELEFISMTPLGAPKHTVPALRVAYYRGQHGRLIRMYGEPEAGTPAADENYTMVYGMTQFDLRYYHKGVWYTDWDSTDVSNRVQFQRRPEVAEVTIRVVDYDGYLERDDQQAVTVTRLIKLGP